MLVPTASDPVLRASIYAAFPRAEGRWGAIHIIDRGCRCSTELVAHLIARQALVEIDELVIMIDRDGVTTRLDTELAHAGYRVRVVAADRADLGAPLVTAPALVVARPDGSLAYVGGHRRDRSFDVPLGARIH